ncbi:MAG: heme exporter ATP-binding protein CcmA [Pseudomonadota bacterium]
MSGGAAALIAFEAVACVRGGRTLFDDISFALASGEALWVRGANGVGKSSLLRLAAGLLRPIAGTVTRRARHAIADENPALDRELTLRNALAFWAQIDGRGLGDVDDALAALGIERLADVPVRILSTGQRRRAGLARLITSGAVIWLLDEPANGLDPAAQTLLEAAIAAHRAHGGTVILASHQPVDLPGAQQLTLAGAGA